MNDARYFLDTNILIYVVDKEPLEKFTKANQLVEHALMTRQGAISFQVVQECLNVMMKKTSTKPATSIQAKAFLVTTLDPICQIYSASSVLYQRALDIKQRWQYSFYDSLIIAAAIQAGCYTLYSEDLQNGQSIETLTIVNPFEKSEFAIPYPSN